MFASYLERHLVDTGLTVAGSGAVYLCWDEGEHHERETTAGISHLTPRGESVYVSTSAATSWQIEVDCSLA